MTPRTVDFRLRRLITLATKSTGNLVFDPPARMVVRSENFLRDGARHHAPCCGKGQQIVVPAIFKAKSKNAGIGDRSGYRAYSALFPNHHFPIENDGSKKVHSVDSFRTIIFYWKLIMHLRSTSLRLNFRDRMGPTPYSSPLLQRRYSRL